MHDRLAAAIASLLLAVPAVASADDISVELIGKALHGQSRPGLVLYARKAVVGVQVRLQREGAAPIVLKAGRIGPGEKKELLFDAPVGTHRYAGSMQVDFIDGTSGEMPLSFDILVSEGVKVQPIEESLDLKAGLLAFTFTGEADKCEYQVLVDGKAPRQGWMRYAGEAPGTRLELEWPTTGEDETVLRIQLTCHDRAGFFSPTLELYPWRIEVPHEDVVFATGSAEIRPEEEGKLEAARVEIEKTLQRYGRALQLDAQSLRLYVVGHTDTVGDAASNRRLSLARARSIAGWFRAKGLKLPIHYAGMGEDALLVPTPDGTDEPRNRRVEYIVAVTAPGGIQFTRL